MENRIDAVLTSENKEAIFQEITKVKSGMPYLVRLSEEDRKSLHKMDDGCKPFVLKCHEMASKHDTIDPGSDLLNLIPADVELYTFLSTIENQLRQILEMVVDTKQLVGSEAYDIARFIYLKARMNLKLGIPGSEAVVEELSKLYKPNCTHTHLISLK